MYWTSILASMPELHEVELGIRKKNPRVMHICYFEDGENVLDLALYFNAGIA